MQTSNGKNVLITGASGLVGSALQSRLNELGYSVFSVTREQHKVSDFSWQPDEGKLWLDPDTSLDVVIHLAGEGIADRRWSNQVKKEILQSRVMGTELLCSALLSRAIKPQVLISASAIGYYGDCGATIVDETTANGEGFLAEVARRWENAARPAMEGGIRTAFLRSGVVLSAQGGLLEKMVPPFKLGLGGRIGSGDQYLSWISITDIINIIVEIIENKTLSGPVNAVSPNPLSNNEFTKQLSMHLKRPHAIPLTEWMARMIFGEMADELMLSGQRVDPAKLRNTDFRFSHEHLSQALQSVLPGPKDVKNNPSSLS